MACFNRLVGICKSKCPRDYIVNGHNYHCPPGLKYEEKEILSLEKNIININLLENMVNAK